MKSACGYYPSLWKNSFILHNQCYCGEWLYVVNASTDMQTTEFILSILALGKYQLIYSNFS